MWSLSLSPGIFPLWYLAHCLPLQHLSPPLSASAVFISLLPLITSLLPAISHALFQTSSITQSASDLPPPGSLVSTQCSLPASGVGLCPPYRLWCLRSFESFLHDLPWSEHLCPLPVLGWDSDSLETVLGSRVWGDNLRGSIGQWDLYR